MGMNLFGIGLPEIFFILLIAFVIFGPKRILDISRSAGRAMRNISKTASDYTSDIEKEMNALDGKNNSSDRKGDLNG